MHGEATGVVSATGAATYFGRTAELVRAAKTASHLDMVVVRLVRALVTLDLILAAAVCLHSLVSGGVSTPVTLDAGVEALAARGLRVLAVATGPRGALRLAGLIGLSDPPRPDSRQLLHALARLGIEVVMVTGDTLDTARNVASQVGLEGPACSAEALWRGESRGCRIVAGVLPEDQFQLVRTLPGRGHVVGMTGDGVNDAPALKQAEVGIAVATATDVARAAASLVLTRAGLVDAVAAIRVSRCIYQRTVTYAVNASVKKLEIPVVLSIAFLSTGILALRPLLMVLLLVTNDFATMAITTDRVMPSQRPDRWQVRGLLVGAVGVALPFLAFTLATFLRSCLAGCAS
jgi:H+-transporting ATPase